MPKISHPDNALLREGQVAGSGKPTKSEDSNRPLSHAEYVARVRLAKLATSMKANMRRRKQCIEGWQHVDGDLLDNEI